MMKFLNVAEALESIASISCPGLASLKKYRSIRAWGALEGGLWHQRKWEGEWDQSP